MVFETTFWTLRPYGFWTLRPYTHLSAEVAESAELVVPNCLEVPKCPAPVTHMTQHTDSAISINLELDQNSFSVRNGR